MLYIIRRAFATVNMAKHLTVEGFENFMKVVSENESAKKDIFVLFTGSIDDKTGKSWCPDCVTGLSQILHYIYLKLWPSGMMSD